MNNSLKGLYCLDFGTVDAQQGYHDGAQKFQGHVKGVAKRFKDHNSTATSVHCL